MAQTHSPAPAVDPQELAQKKQMWQKFLGLMKWNIIATIAVLIFLVAIVY